MSSHVRARVFAAALLLLATASPCSAQLPCAPTRPDGLVVADDTRSGDEFGYSVAISGRTAVVGAWVDETATVFVRQGGAWMQETQLLPPDAEADDQFSYSLAIDGDTILVGSKLDDDAGLNSGSAHVFVRSAGVWTHQAKRI